MFQMQVVIGASIESTYMETPVASEYCGAEFEAMYLWMWICICHPKYCCYMFGLSISIISLSISQFHIYLTDENWH